MITKNPAIINVLNCAKTGFSFIVKEGDKNYSVYDTNIFSRKRELAAIEGDEEYISLNKELLDMYGLSYKKVSDTRIELFDPECEEYEDVELPLYRKDKNSRFGSSYTYMNTTSILKNVPTKKMVEASNKYLSDFKFRVVKDALIAEVDCNIEFGLDLVSTIVETRYKITEDYLDMEKYYTFAIKEPYKHVGKYQTLVIDKKRAKKEAKDGVLQIAAPKDVAGIIIGKGGRCTKAMAQDLGFKYIDVKAY